MRYKEKIIMELVKNIFFNTYKLVQNSTIKISYTGELFQDNSEDVYIHYGFGTNWDNLNDVKMNKTELGFQAEIYLPESNLFNFCFRNSANKWDNNNNENYSFIIDKPELSLAVRDERRLQTDHVRKLRKTYIWSKKVKIAVYKIVKFFPKIISGNYRKKINSQQ